ncbi:MAG: 3-phosphoshikimate 1-carboxyvinyltransferase [Clostridiales bacterium]|nr:3-phosphoshikimate 1-carboxyvinyltransferase [Clostridiales bacterium]
MERISPRACFEGEFSLPGDKSVTHRAIMLNGGADGEGVITNALMGEDCLSTCRCMRALGAKIDVDGTTLRVVGTPRFRRGTKLNCGNSGTTIRLLTGFVAGKEIDAELYGDESLSARPMKRVAEPLSLLGADVKTTDGHAPVYVSPKTLHGADVALQIASAQVKSAVLLAGLSADGETRVIEPIKSRDHTERMLQAMGADLRVDGNEVRVKKSALKGVDVCVPSDISSAAYFMALGALKGKTLCKNVGINSTRTGILKAFDLLGVNYTLLNRQVSGGEERADILVEKSDMRAINLTRELVPSMIDELPLIALLCAFADGETRITGAKELRVKESDRIRTTAELINNLGGDCEELPDGFIIRGREKLVGGDVDSYLDHRIAMTAAVGMIASQTGGRIYRPECCAISFPDFFEKLGLKLY